MLDNAVRSALMIDELIATGDRVIVRWTGTYIH